MILDLKLHSYLEYEAVLCRVVNIPLQLLLRLFFIYFLYCEAHLPFFLVIKILMCCCEEKGIYVGDNVMIDCNNKD